MTEFLFSAINQAKDLGCYDIANRAFAVLLCHALQGGNEFLFEVESDTFDLEGFDWHEDYYAVLNIWYNGQCACIPVPLLKEEILCRIDQFCPEVVERGEHNRELLAVKEPIRKQLLNTLDWALWRMYPRCHDEAVRLLNVETATPEGWETKGYVSIFDHTEALWRSLWKPTFWEFRGESLLPEHSWCFDDYTLWEILPYIPNLIKDGYTTLWDVE